ncbi:hypothetical protein GCM10011346_45810 [Oceanobacillus neutriphilus]|uniref:Uncharacterized protein n=1 Tax=Oceanobacillus neutriphilus TaxID=531815 RepID=A0ABQ2P1K1_9BACI|nr:hypothetical protein GCM10011346_45810 [Oceanobacillus neutriphilus]
MQAFVITNGIEGYINKIHPKDSQYFVYKKVKAFKGFSFECFSLYQTGITESD